MCRAQGLNAVTPLRLEPATPRSRAKHSNTEPLRSRMYSEVTGETMGLDNITAETCLILNFGEKILRICHYVPNAVICMDVITQRC